MKLVLLLISAILMGSCFALPIEEQPEPLVIVEPPETQIHRTAQVVSGNLSRYLRFNLVNLPAREEVLTFDIPNVHIEAIHVEAGDFVRAGDIVAELNRNDFIRQLEAAQRQEAAARLNISHLDERIEIYEQEALAKGDAYDESPHISTRTAYQAEVNIQQIQTEHLHMESERRLLRANIDGIVTYAMPLIEGERSAIGRHIVAIADQTETFFVLEGSGAEYLIPGESHELLINDEPWQAIVVDQEDIDITNTENRGFLAVHGEIFPERTRAWLYLVLEEAEDVLSVPRAALHNVNDRNFVYVLDDGVKTIRFVEIGLLGNAGIEIISGLNYGDLVII